MSFFTNAHEIEVNGGQFMTTSNNTYLIGPTGKLDQQR